MNNLIFDAGFLSQCHVWEQNSTVLNGISNSCSFLLWQVNFFFFLLWKGLLNLSFSSTMIIFCCFLFFWMYLCSSFDILTQFSNSRWFSLWHNVIIQSLIVNPCFCRAAETSDQRPVQNSLASISVMRVKKNIQKNYNLPCFCNLVTRLSP